MSLSSQCRAEYAELINQQLDNIPIHSIEDFELVKQCLKEIIQADSESLLHHLPEKYQDRMLYIRGFLLSPEDYVEQNQNYNEYKQLITDRIFSKIGEIESFNITQKLSYIQNQVDIASTTLINQDIMKQAIAPKPGSLNHTLPDEESNVEYNEILNNAVAEGLLTEDDVSAFSSERLLCLIEPECINALRAGLFSAADLHRLEENTIWKLIQPEVLNALRDNVFSISEMHEPDWSDALLDSECLAAIEEGLFTKRDLKEMDASAAQTFIHSDFLDVLRARIVGVDDLKGISNTAAYYLCEPEPIKAFREKIFNMNDIRQFSDNDVRYFLRPESLEALKDKIYTMEDIREMDEDIIYLFLDPKILEAIRERRVTVEQLKEMGLQDIINSIHTGTFEEAPAPRRYPF